jgi:hypothetical protein
MGYHIMVGQRTQYNYLRVGNTIDFMYNMFAIYFFLNQYKN